MSAPTTTSAPVVARGLVRTFAARPVLDGVDLVAAPGTRVGLIGENGTGKSTLLRLLAGRDLPDAGSVQVPDDVVYLPQEPQSGTHGNRRDPPRRRPAPAARGGRRAGAPGRTDGRGAGHR